MQPHETNQKLLAFSRWIDGSYEQHVQNNKELMLHRRLGKLTEENGEVSEALSGYLGENPRKGRTHELKDVQKELLDVAVTAFGAWAHTTGNQEDALEALARHIDFLVQRASHHGLHYEPTEHPS